MIEMIKDGQNWISIPKEIAFYFVTKFEELYSSSHPSFPAALEGLGDKFLTLEITRI